MKKSPILNATTRTALAFTQESAIGVYGIGQKAVARAIRKSDIGGKLAREGDVWVNANTGNLWLLYSVATATFTWGPVSLFDFDQESQSRIRNYVDLDIFKTLMKKAYRES